MKIKETFKIDNRIAEIWEERHFQNRIDSALFESISKNNIALENIEPVEKAAKEFRENLLNKGQNNLTEDQALMFIMLKSYVEYVAPGRFKNSVEERLVLSSVVGHSKIFTSHDFSDNPYLRNIELKSTSAGRLEYTKKRYEPYELMFYNAPYCIDGTNITLPSVGFFRDGLDYPCILDNKREWISLTPYEIYTMQEHIDKAEGNVLIIGCGLGYYTYMCSLKENVKSITVVERGKDVAEIFRNSILPQFQNKDKVTLIEADAFSYLDELPDGKFDTCITDIYDGMGNFDFYYRLRNTCRRFRKMKVSYLHEENFLSYAEDFVVLEMMEAYTRERKMAETTIPNIPEREMRLKNYISKLFADVEISKESDINRYLNAKTILKMMNKSKEEY